MKSFIIALLMLFSVQIQSKICPLTTPTETIYVRDKEYEEEIRPKNVIVDRDSLERYGEESKLIARDVTIEMAAVGAFIYRADERVVKVKIEKMKWGWAKLSIKISPPELKQENNIVVYSNYSSKKNLWEFITLGENNDWMMDELFVPKFIR